MSDNADPTPTPTPGSTPEPIPVSGAHLGAAYDRLRARGGVQPVRLPDGSDAWLVTSHDLVCQALADTRLSLNRRHSRGGWSGFALPPALDANLLNMDPPDHTRIRRLVNSAFTSQRVAALRPDIRKIADELLDALPPTGTTDLVDNYCAPLAIRVIAELLGVPSDDHTNFRAWATTMLTTHPVDRQAVAQSVVQLHGFIIGLLQAKREQPGDDLLSALIRAEEDGDRLARDELTSLAFLMLLAGYENSVNLIATTLLRLLTHGELPRDPEQIAEAIEESLRQEPPAPVAIRRFPVEDLTIGGTRIPAGATVLLGLAAANRDPAASTNLAFGRGIHRCIGASLARAEAAEAIAALAERLPALTLARPAGQLRWRPSFRTHGPIELPASW